jgi:peptidyl-prolyl cis-trans isomerase B (cyclophilin B)
VSGKQAKREKRREREAQRAVTRRRQRQRTTFTAIVIGFIVVIGGVLIGLSIERPPAQEVAEQSSEPPSAAAPAVAACEPAPAPASAGLAKPTFAAPPPQSLQPGTDYRATLDTSCGRVVIDLYEDRAPQAVNSFAFLAQQGFFDGLTVFRNATSISALQTGAGTNEATFSIGYTFPDELAAAEQEGYTAGSLAMANSGPNTNGSQFFVTYADSPLPPQYTKFGQVATGLEVLQAIGAIPANGETPTKPVYLNSVTIETTSATPAAPPG